MSGADPAPRVTPGTRREIGLVNALIARVIGVVTGGGAPNVFTTLARHRRLYRPWLRFARVLMPGGTLPRADTELVILRVAHNCTCPYELGQHQRLARRAGLRPEQIEAAAIGADAGCWTARQALLLRAADQLHADRTLSDDLWADLARVLTETQLIELPMLVGHYEMLAMTLNSLRVQPDHGGRR
ncbi:MAG TPA: carboxymuconolactone decarboxylase family protein [Pseudonocardiaceae bacterium]|nr:carboxymuconolactone decarboxylase family protein [Pseudonocardiaceae bacterium]